MLIRTEQIQEISRALEDEFVKRMITHLRDNFPKELKLWGIEENKLESLVREGMVNAEKYGVIYEEDIQVYLECMVILAPAFDRDKVNYSWAGEILRRKDTDGGDKMMAISRHLTFELSEPPTDVPLAEGPDE